MKLFEKIKNMIYRAARPAAGADDEKLLEWLGISRTPKKVLSEVTYFTCLKMLSETLAKMPIKFYQQTDRGVEEAETNKAYELLKTRPNPQMTPSTFWATVENNRNHYGNAYVWIRREFNRMMYGGEIEIKDLWIMPSADTTIVIDDKGVFGDSGDIYYWYTDKYSGESYIFPSGDVLHFKTSMTFDGYSGAPVREILKATIEGGLESQNFLNNLYKGGLTARAVLQYTGDMSPKLEKALIARLEKYANGANNAGKFIPIPIGMKIEPLNIKLTDSQFFELKKYSALQIAGAFGIKPNQINDYEKSSYANSEMQNISFYIDTELFILKQYEEELDYKLLEPSDRRQGKYYKFNENVILRTDAKSQAMILNHYPPVIKQIKDIQQIAKAEDIEFTKLNTSITEVIRNMFVFTADETGVKRFEKLLGITPKTAQSLDDRKIYIISMMNRRKMSLEELTAMLSNYSEGIRLINDMSNFEMIVEINTDAGSLETINSIIDEILPLNIYFEFALQRQTTIKYKLEDLIFMAFEPAAGENEHCNFDNNITAIKKADYTQSVAGFSYVNSYESAGAFVCGVECCLAMQAPFETQESVVNIETATEAETTPIRTCGEENAIIGEDTPFTMAESAVTVQEDVTAAVTQLKICGTDYAREEG